MNLEATRDQYVNLWYRLSNETRSPTLHNFVEFSFDDLEKRYKTPSRKYHTLTHVGWGLHRVDEMEEDDKTRGGKHEPRDWDLVRFAFWYHDAVLEGGSDDEEESAFLGSFAMLQCNKILAPDVTRLVQATSHERVPRRMDEAVICDADLSILGSNQEAFDRYEELVREEWAHVPDNLFKPARHVILKRFASRPWIYMTDYGRARWERRARANLARSMEKLAK